MNNLEFSFEDSLAEQFLEGLTENDTVSASQLLTVLESEEESSADEIFESLANLTADLDLSDLPLPARMVCG